MARFELGAFARDVGVPTAEPQILLAATAEAMRMISY